MSIKVLKAFSFQDSFYMMIDRFESNIYILLYETKKHK